MRCAYGRCGVLCRGFRGVRTPGPLRLLTDGLWKHGPAAAAVTLVTGGCIGAHAGGCAVAAYGFVVVGRRCAGMPAMGDT